MRIWSLHPKYLDPAGLVALWRETLLARAVLSGATRGYQHHPQLHRFQATRDPVATIDRYLAAVYDEACERGYHFDASKFIRRRKSASLAVTSGQIAFSNHTWNVRGLGTAVGRTYLLTTPRQPSEMRAATLVRMRGSARPPGDTR
jgi:hypothetical protein